MKEEAPICLPQLPNEIVKDAKKTRLCAYAVAIEGWRRGLTLKWYTSDSEHFEDMIIFGVNPPGRLFSLSSEKRTHYFFRTRGDLVPNEAVEIGSEKDDTKVYLEKAGVPVPLGKGFLEGTTDEEIISYARSLGFPLVLKPTNASLGNGVVTNIKSDEEFLDALHYVRTELVYDEVVVEQYVTGKEYRVYVVDDKVVAAYNRKAANITGDGIHTIEELIDIKNKQRKKNARLHSCLIEPDIEIEKFIHQKGYSFESIPKEGEELLLRQKTNVSSGGDPIDVTDSISDEIKKIAVNALHAVPGLYHGGVDIIVNEGQTSKHPAVVIELNPTAQIGGALYPLVGKSRNIPAAIIDYYFPETKGYDTTDSKVYFELGTVLEPLENRSTLEIEVAPAPQGKLYARKFIVSGTVNRYSYHEWLKNKALDMELHGHIKNIFNGEIEIVVAGTNKDAIEKFKDLTSNFDKKVKIKDVRSESYEEPIKVGFEINEKYNAKNPKSVSTTLRRMEKNMRNMNKALYEAEKRRKYILSSNSWKVSEPVRKIENLIKK